MRCRCKLFFVFLCMLICIGLSAEQNLRKHVIGHWPGGLGVCLHSILNQLNYCEHINQIPVMFLGEGSLYYTPKGFKSI